MVEPLQYRILPNNGAGWYWEVVTEDREVIARGVAEMHAQARADAEKVSLPGPMTGEASHRGATMITVSKCKTYANECRHLGMATDISVQRVTVLMAMSRSWTALANQKERLDDTYSGPTGARAGSERYRYQPARGGKRR